MTWLILFSKFSGKFLADNIVGSVVVFSLLFWIPLSILVHFVVRPDLNKSFLFQSSFSGNATIRYYLLVNALTNNEQCSFFVDFFNVGNVNTIVRVGSCWFMLVHIDSLFINYVNNCNFLL